MKLHKHLHIAGLLLAASSQLPVANAEIKAMGAESRSWTGENSSDRDFWKTAKSKTVLLAELHANRVPEIGQNYFGVGAHFIQSETSEKGLFRFDARLASQHPIADQGMALQKHGVVGEVDGDFYDFTRPVYLGGKLVEGDSTHFEGAAFRGGVTIGNLRYHAAFYGGESLSKEYVQDLMTFSALVGVRMDLQPTDWLELRAACDAGLVFAGSREGGATRSASVIQRPYGLEAATATGLGSRIDARLQLLVKLWKEHLALATAVRFRRVEIPTPAREVSTNMHLEVSAGGAF